MRRNLTKQRYVPCFRYLRGNLRFFPIALTPPLTLLRSFTAFTSPTLPLPLYLTFIAPSHPHSAQQEPPSRTTDVPDATFLAPSIDRRSGRELIAIQQELQQCTPITLSFTLQRAIVAPSSCLLPARHQFHSALRRGRDPCP